jgi:predicted RNase H-like HicB family nuclease
MRDLTQYPFEVRPLHQDKGGYLISFPDFSECIADGETVEEALHNGLDALAETIAALESLGLPVPQPGSGGHEYDFSNARRGAIDPVAAGKTRITIRIDDDLLEWFRQQVHALGGGNYQTLINQALREYVQRQNEPLEDILRRVVREELARAA